MEISPEQVAKTFEIWRKEVRDNPDDFLNCDDIMASQTDEEAGKADAEAFLFYFDKLMQMESHGN